MLTQMLSQLLYQAIIEDNNPVKSIEKYVDYFPNSGIFYRYNECTGIYRNDPYNKEIYCTIAVKDQNIKEIDLWLEDGNIMGITIIFNQYIYYENIVNYFGLLDAPRKLIGQPFRQWSRGGVIIYTLLPSRPYPYGYQSIYIHIDKDFDTNKYKKLHNLN